MIGVLVFFVAIISFGRKKYVWALVLFLAFCYRHMSIIPKNMVGLDGPDFAVLCMVIAFVFGDKHVYMPDEDTRLKRLITYLFVFVLLCMGYSIIRYGLSLVNVLMAVRMSLILPAYYLLKRIDPIWIERSIVILYGITFVHAILFVIEAVTGLPIMGYQAEFDSLTGTYRYLNWPPLNGFFLFLSVLYPNYVKLPSILDKYKKFAAVVFLAVEICTFGRLRMAATFAVLVYGLLLQGKGKTIVTTAAFFVILAIPFLAGVQNRMDNDGDSASDIETILSGGIKRYARTGIKEGGTMSYRLAMLYERVDGLIDGSRPITDAVFGYGTEYDPSGESRIVLF